MVDLKSLELKLYDCQLGMYFSKIEKLENGFIVYSNFVEDYNWNFFTGFTALTVQDFLTAYEQAKKFMKSINREPCFVISLNTNVSSDVMAYINTQFNNISNTASLLANEIYTNKTLNKDYSFKRINNSTEKDLFINTFKTSKSQSLPTDVYKPLPQYYFDALENSFFTQSEWNFYHYISIYNNQPIGMISACVKDDYCGLYGAGTYIKYRGKGVLSNMLKFIQQDLSQIGIKNYFCITEKNSYNERLYNYLGFKTVLDLCYFIEKQSS